MSRPMLPRRMVLKSLRCIAFNVRTMMAVWGWTPKFLRYGQADPALDREQWKRLAEFAQAMEWEARGLREMAEKLDGTR